MVSTINNNLVNISKVAIYCRVSSEEQKQGKTINSQIQELEDFARASNYKIIERYIDDGWSGGLLERPALDRLRDAASKGLFEAVLINDVDRLSREVLHLGIIKKDLEKKGAKLIFKKLPHTEDPMSNFMINMLGSFAEFERQMIADRVRRGKKYKVEVRNLIMGNTPPYGYDYVPKTKEKEGFYEINKKEAEIVKTMFNWVVKDGLSERRVVKRLYELKISSRKRSAWGGSSVHRVLTNSTYIGITYWNKHKSVESEDFTARISYKKQNKDRRILRSKDEWIQIRLPDQLKIINEDAFYAAQLQLKRNKWYAKRNNNTNFYLLTGLVWCGQCGYRCAGTPCHGKLYYRCTNRLRMFPRPSKCKAGFTGANKFDEIVWNAVVNAIQNPALILKQVEKFEEKQKEEPSQTEKEIEETEKRLKNLAIEEERLFEAYRKQVIEIGQFEREMGKVNAEKNQLNLVLKNLKNKEISRFLKKETAKSIQEYCQSFKEKLYQFTPKERQTFLRLLLEKVIIENKKARILGVIPLNKSLQSNNIPGNTRFLASSGNIALQPINRYEHNTTFKFELEVKL